MASYDRGIIRTHADRLYTTANLIILLCGLALAAAGVAIGAVVEFAGAGGVVGGLFGVLLGMTLSFNLKLRAQTALCQLRVEENTAQLVALYAGHVARPQFSHQVHHPQAPPSGS